ncbi:MAG TPA: SDR family oxidoreductase [Xanthobacteraceae bacterium]|jgi:3-oxoacyl-[acyl-carrier protein] reductase|nr:SDR family oxidoreductase [Xanthobacteraceae bacterium]
MNGQFADKVVLITGGARNLGRAMGIAFGTTGASVAINARTARPELGETIAEIQAAGGRSLACLGDITDRAAVDGMIAAILDRLGRLDILINNATTHATKPFLDLSFEDWRETMTSTLDGAFHCTQAAVPSMIKAGGGSIVNMGGLFGHMPIPNRAPTAAAKAGLAGLTRALALELAVHNINVNYLAPGPANTIRKGPFQFDMKRIPFERFAEPAEIIAAIMMLCGRDGRFMTGQTIHVNGGLYMNN